MSYSITLYNTVFDKDNNNVILFDTQAEFISYLNSTANVTMSLQNFDAKNIISTSVTFVVPNNYKLLDILNYNYCKVEGTDTGNTDVLFYWIKHSRQNQGNNIQLELEIDPWGTYIYAMKSSTSSLQGMLQRTHYDRIKKVGTKYQYNWTVNSPLFEREDIQNSAKMVSKKEKMKIRYSSNDTINNWLNDNVECWLYAFISPAKYKYGEYNTANEVQENLSYLGYYNNTSVSGLLCFCAPVYKTTKHMTFCDHSSSVSQHQIRVDVVGIEQFFKLNFSGISDALYSLKYSIMPPFDSISGSFDIDANGNLNLNEMFLGLKTSPSSSNNLGVVYIMNQSRSPITLETTEQFQNEFTDLEVKSLNNDPKLYNEDFSIYNIYFGGQTYSLPISKSSNKPKFKYYEALTPDVTKFYLTYDNGSDKDSGIFNSNTAKDFTGLVGTLDLSQWFASDQLANYIATNKNNLQIFQNNQEAQSKTTAINALSGLILGAGATLATGKPIGMFAGALNAGRSYQNLQINSENERINRELTRDNMAQAPDKLSTVNSNALFIRLIDDLGIYIELQEMIPFERDQVKDQLKRFGYTYNVIADIRDYFKTRKFYNYIQADVFDLNIPVSEDVKEIIKSMFAKGVRIWHGDTFTGINFNQINYERSIE